MCIYPFPNPDTHISVLQTSPPHKSIAKYLGDAHSDNDTILNN